MRILVAWAALLGCLLAVPAAAQPATWVDEDFDFVRILPDAPNSDTPIVSSSRRRAMHRGFRASSARN